MRLKNGKRANQSSNQKTTRGTAQPSASVVTPAKDYLHTAQTMTARPEIGAAPRFKSRQKPATYRYDSSLSPALEWDSNPARDTAAFLIDCIEAAAALPHPHLFPEHRVLHGADGEALMQIAGLQDALAALKRMQAPFLNWAGKAERLSFDVPTLPLFVHERLSTAAIVKTLEDHRKQPDQDDMFGLFADPHRPMAEQVRAYEYRDKWVNRMILGDSLVVMNSLLRFEGLGGQVQMIYMDPPYGVKFGSNFQPFVRDNRVSASDDSDMTREPEMVQAYRDTWHFGIHSYLSYLRDRLLVARDLLAPSGSLFVQISGENVHHVRELMDELFAAENRLTTIVFRKTTGAGSPSGYVELVPETVDYLLWYARDRERTKIRHLYRPRDLVADYNFRWVEAEDGSRRSIGADEDVREMLGGYRVFRPNPLTSQTGGPTTTFDVEFQGRTFKVNKGGWKTNAVGMQRLKDARRLHAIGNTLGFVRYHDDFPYVPIIDLWDDTRQSGFGAEKLYVVQTSPKVIERCILMTTEPGDLVLDPTCGSGTSAYTAEQWGRRWITIDTSRVPLTLARQRLLSATFPWYRLRDESAGPASGFVFSRRRNRKGEEVGGIVPHITLKSIVNDEPPVEEVLVDRPEQDTATTRITGPFVVEATLPTPLSPETTNSTPATPPDDPGDHIARMIEYPPLPHPRPARQPQSHVENHPPPRPQPVALRRGDGRYRNHRRHHPAVRRHRRGRRNQPQRTAVLRNPRRHPVRPRRRPHHRPRRARRRPGSQRQSLPPSVCDRLRLYRRSPRRDFGRRRLLGLPVSAVTATMDLQMGDLLKNQRSSQIFAVCGLPEISVIPLDPAPDGTPRWQVKLLGLDVFNPIDMTTDHCSGDNVPCWMLDTNWNNMVFHADQVFFPRTSAWENLRRALSATHDDSVWAHLAGDTSAPFAALAGQQIAVKVLDDRGNELPVIRTLGLKQAS